MLEDLCHIVIALSVELQRLLHKNDLLNTASQEEYCGRSEKVSALHELNTNFLFDLLSMKGKEKKMGIA